MHCFILHKNILNKRLIVYLDAFIRACTTLVEIKDNVGCAKLFSSFVT
jgi:hypothetical protein